MIFAIFSAIHALIIATNQEVPIQNKRSVSLCQTLETPTNPHNSFSIRIEKAKTYATANTLRLDQ